MQDRLRLLVVTETDDPRTLDPRRVAGLDSVGHRIDLETACELVLRLSPSYRLPETTRRADQLARRALKAAKG